MREEMPATGIEEWAERCLGTWPQLQANYKDALTKAREQKHRADVLAAMSANREEHCYMFREEPPNGCMQHTLREKSLRTLDEALADAMADMPELRDELVRAGLIVPNEQNEV